jgi:hydrogenase nickel incorporation protein HypA/HybF
MHEMSIVEALLQSVENELRAHPHARVREVRVRVGRLRQVEPVMLRFCYEAAVNETSLAGSRLEIEEIEARARCAECGHEFAVEENWFECPHCRSTNGRLLTGNELLLTGIEIEAGPRLTSCLTAT